MGYEWILLLAVILGGAAVLWGSHSEVRALREDLKAAPRTPIERVSTGAVCVQGKVGRHATTTVAPLSGRTCVAWVIMVHRASDDSAFPGEDRVSETCDFWIADDTGRALVETTEPVKLVPSRTTIWDFGSISPEAEERVKQLLKQHDVWSWTMAGNPFMHFEESTLEEGDIATVVGYAMREPHVDGRREGLREPPTIARIRTGGPNEPLMISSDAARTQSTP